MPILTAEERLGHRLADRYRLDSVLGTGGMGVLFRAFDETSQSAVAVKMLKPVESLEPERVARFDREMRIACTLQHPNIAAYVDSGWDEAGHAYLVMELLEGSSLEQVLTEQGVLSFEEALAIAFPIAKALSAAHARGVIHRDVKPSNIFLCHAEDGTVIPKLLDFGIARSRIDSFETRTGVFVGTPGYVAPEQAKNGECGPFTDVWAVGAVLYRCLVGHSPHSGGSVPEILARLVHESAPPLVVNGIKKSACATIDRALARDPERRYQTMQTFIVALEKASKEAQDEGATDELPGVTVRESTPPPSSVRQLASVERAARPLWRPIAAALAGATLAFAVVSQHAKRAEAERASVAQTETAAANRQSVPRLQIGASVPATPHLLAEPDPSLIVTWTRSQEPEVRLPRTARRAAQIRPRALPVERSPSVQVGSATHRGPERERNTGLPVATEW